MSNSSTLSKPAVTPNPTCCKQHLLICFISLLLPSRHGDPLKLVISCCSGAHSPPTVPCLTQNKSQGANRGLPGLTPGCLLDAICYHSPPCLRPSRHAALFLNIPDLFPPQALWAYSSLFLECSSPAITAPMSPPYRNHPWALWPKKQPPSLSNPLPLFNYFSMTLLLHAITLSK